jgi:hypothetical protein
MRLTSFTPHIRTTLAVTMIGLAVLTTVACSPDDVTKPAAPNGVAASRAGTAGGLAPGAEQHIARTLALALQDPAVRTQVRDAMRASLVDEHKLVLQKFVQSPSGKAMLEAAARKNGVSVRSIETQIAALPALDFYMPIRAHRQSWRGTDDVLVVATLDRKGPFVGYTTAGEAVSIAGQKWDELDPLFMLHPAEPAGLRVHPQAAAPGMVIEDATDGQGSERITWYSVRGDSLTVDFGAGNVQEQLASLNALLVAEGKMKRSGDFEVSPQSLCTCYECPEQDFCQPPPPPPPPSDTTFITAFEMEFCDDDYCQTNDEIRITAVYRNASGVELGRAVYRHGDVNPHSLYVVNAPLIFKRIQEGSGQYMQMNLVEEDGAPVNNDDWCGDFNVYSAQNGQAVFYPNDPQGCSANPPTYQYSAWVQYSWTPKY